MATNWQKRCLSRADVPFERVRATALRAGKSQDILLSHAGNSGTPDRTASELTYVCPILVW